MGFCQQCNWILTQLKLKLFKQITVNNEEISKHEIIFNENVNKKIAIARKFIENTEFREKLKLRKNNWKKKRRRSVNAFISEDS